MVHAASRLRTRLRICLKYGILYYNVIIYLTRRVNIAIFTQLIKYVLTFMTLRVDYRGFYSARISVLQQREFVQTCVIIENTLLRVLILLYAQRKQSLSETIFYSYGLFIPFVLLNFLSHAWCFSNLNTPNGYRSSFHIITYYPLALRQTASSYI